jgi:uncharacterized membrane protein YgdD (TMEM256/DUF423 family)
MASHNQSRWLLCSGAVLGALGIALGAFGAHALQSYLAARVNDAEFAARWLNTWEVAVRYQMYQALALLAAGLLAERGPQRSLTVAGLSITAGVLLFSGLLYCLVLTGQRILGAIVPVGGVLMIVGWLAIAVAAWQRTEVQRSAPPRG